MCLVVRGHRVHCIAVVVPQLRAADLVSSNRLSESVLNRSSCAWCYANVQAKQPSLPESFQLERVIYMLVIRSYYIRSR